jgi:hypothetical protein
MDLYHDHIQQKVNITAGSIVFLFILEIEQIPQEGGEISDFICNTMAKKTNNDQYIEN